MGFIFKGEPTASGPDLYDDLAMLGKKVERPKHDEHVLEILEENSDALDVFLSMSTQWNVGGMGAIVGLNYSALEVVMRILKVKTRNDCFWRIRVMEAEALRLMSESRDNG